MEKRADLDEVNTCWEHLRVATCALGGHRCVVTWPTLSCEGASERKGGAGRKHEFGSRTAWQVLSTVCMVDRPCDALEIELSEAPKR